MKKNILMALSVLVLFSTINIAHSKVTVSNELSSAIQMYKAGNYVGCYTQLEEVVKIDPSNPLVYYYLGMASAQLGRKDEAIQNYERAITLSPKSNNLTRYAKKGKRCIETPDKCEESMFDSADDEFILNKASGKFSEKVKSDFERLKIENFMREMNNSDDIDPQKFKEYKNFSSVPTDEEVVAAIRVLQNAGFGNLLERTNIDYSMLTNNGMQQNSMLNLMGGASMNPQLIQALLTNNMAQGF